MSINQCIPAFPWLFPYVYVKETSRSFFNLVLTIPEVQETNGSYHNKGGH